jgi:hypothetical protein
MDAYHKYINNYGSISHILNIFINDELDETEKNIVISTIYDTIDGKKIVKNIRDICFQIIWRVPDETNLLQYYTNGFIMSDEAVHEHTKMVMNNIRQIIGKDKFSFMITKPITKKICIM